MANLSEELAHEDYEHQTAYVFAPKSSAPIVDARPSKRQKVAQQPPKKDEVDGGETIYFPTLLSGAESKECVLLRQKLYEESWDELNSCVEAILEEANEKTLTEVTEFLGHQSPFSGDTIPTGLIVTGPNIASQELLFNQLGERIQQESGSIVVTLRSGDATNLKTVLKKLIRDATDEEHDDEDEKTSSTSTKSKLLNYDLQILQNLLKSNPTRKVVISFQDSEAFDSSLLTELILLFKSWLDRIPFITLFGIATSVELFHERLTRSAIMCLRGVQFDVENTSKTLEKIFRSVIVGPGLKLRFGANFLGSLLERQHDHVQSLQAFVAALKYAYMTHFYANPLSILLLSPGVDKTWKHILPSFQREHAEALRMLPSFKNAIEEALKDGKADYVRNMFDDSGASQEILHKVLDVRRGQEQHFCEQVEKLEILNAALSHLKLASADGPIELYIKFISDSLNNSDTINDLITAIKRLTPKETKKFIHAVNMAIIKLDMDEKTGKQGQRQSDFDRDMLYLAPRTMAILEEEASSGTQIRSIYTQQSSLLRTAVVGNKVQLSKTSAVLSPSDATFTKIIEDLISTFRRYFTFIHPAKEFGHELWLYDARSPYRETFTPRPRHAIERALSTPHDYLGCSCCGQGLSGSQPPSAILYQLYLETGSLINVFDLWSAFNAIVKEEGSEEEERKTLMLFYQALADLKMMGAVKMSRKRTDCLGKMSWMGL